jgi:shikimate kinase
MTAPRPIALVGPRGAGKSTVGRLLARALDRPFVDLDVEVEGRVGASIAELLARHGEPGFRDLEARALRDALAGVPPPVVATGGGAPLRPTSRALLAEEARVVYLAAAPEVLAARVAADPLSSARRPALAPGGPLEEARALVAARDPVYREVAEVVVDASGPPEEVVRAIVAALEAAPDPGAAD